MCIDAPCCIRPLTWTANKTFGVVFGTFATHRGVPQSEGSEREAGRVREGTREVRFESTHRLGRDGRISRDHSPGKGCLASRLHFALSFFTSSSSCCAKQDLFPGQRLQVTCHFRGEDCSVGIEKVLVVDGVKPAIEVLVRVAKIVYVRAHADRVGSALFRFHL